MSQSIPEDRPHSDLTRSILESAMRVQSALGVGLYEKPYKVCLAHALRQKGHRVLMEVKLDITFEGLLVPESYRIDVLVDDTVVVEAKTVERLTPIHQAQVLTYLRLSGKEVGLLLNFWACPLKDGGIQRLVLSRDRA
jgi:GxxExxY protein